MLSSGKIDKYTGEELLPSDPNQIIQKARFIYSPLGKAFEKQREIQAGVLKSLKLSHKINELK